RRLLAALHDDVHELGEHVVVEFRVRQDGADGSLGSTGHILVPALLLGALRAVLRPALLALADAGAIEGATDRVIANAWQILHAATADEHHRVLLQVVTLATDVAGHFIAVREAYAADLAQCGIRLLGCHRVHARAHPALLGRCPECRHLGLFGLQASRLPDELTRGRHVRLVSRNLEEYRAACSRTVSALKDAARCFEVALPVRRAVRAGPTKAGDSRYGPRRCQPDRLTRRARDPAPAQPDAGAGTTAFGIARTLTIPVPSGRQSPGLQRTRWAKCV